MPGVQGHGSPGHARVAHDGRRRARPGDRAARIAQHIRMFWEPRMREQLSRQVADAGADCDTCVAQAVDLLDLERAAS
ncbi:MAG: formate dehydrogenase subunit delta [Haloechinothrix sp.]